MHWTRAVECAHPGKAITMTRKTAPKRPPIHMIATQADILADLAIGVQDRLPQVSELLLEEIARAKVHSAGRISKDVVTMNAQVEFVDETSNATRIVQLVYPRHADIAANRISILTPIGAGLIGLREGQSILWPDRVGHERKLTIVKVRQNACEEEVAH